MSHSEGIETFDRDGARLHVPSTVVMPVDGGGHRSPIAPGVADAALWRLGDPYRSSVGDPWRGPTRDRLLDARRPDPETNA